MVDLAVLNKADEARRILRELDRVVVAFSGGVDSTLLLRLAQDSLGDRCLAVTAVSPSLSARERRDAAELAEQRKPWFLAVNLVNPHDVMFYNTDRPGEPVQ